MKNPLRTLFSFTRYESARSDPIRTRARGEPLSAEQELSALSLEEIINACRDAFANNGFVRNIVAANDVYSVGDGITPQAQTASEAWNEAAELYFARWSRFADVDGRFSLEEATSLASQRLDVDGEFFAVKYRAADGTPKLGFYEAQDAAADFSDASQNIIQGIRFFPGTRRRAAGYFFRGVDGERFELPASCVIHCMIADTFSSVHGLSQIQHSVNNIRDTKDILRYIVARGKIQNAFALTLRSDRAAGAESFVGAPTKAAVYGGEDSSGTSSTERERSNALGIEDAVAAKIIKLKESEALEALTPNSPDQNSLEALAMLDRRSCGGVLPPDFFTPSKVSGTQTRAVNAQAARSFGRRQTHLIRHFLQPVWTFVIGDAIARGKLPAQPDWLFCEWNCPRSITVDTGRDAAAEREDIAAGLRSRSDSFGERGMNFRRELTRVVADQVAYERALAQAREAAGLPKTQN